MRYCACCVRCHEKLLANQVVPAELKPFWRGQFLVVCLITALVIMAQYTYDEQGVTFNYFVLSVLALFLIPLTVQWIYRTFKDAKGNCPCLEKSGGKRDLSQLNLCINFFYPLGKAGKAYCNCEPCKTKSARLAAAKKTSAVRHIANAKYVKLWILYSRKYTLVY